MSLVSQQSGPAVRLRPIAITLVAALALALGWPVAASAASPNATVAVADSFLTAGETSLVTITFSEKVAQFTVNDMVAQSGTLGGLATTDDVTFTATLTPDADASTASNVVRLNLFGVTDLGGVAGSTIVQSNSYRVDTRRPTAAVVVSDTALSIGETSPNSGCCQRSNASAPMQRPRTRSMRGWNTSRRLEFALPESYAVMQFPCGGDKSSRRSRSRALVMRRSMVRGWPRG